MPERAEDPFCIILNL